MTAVAGPDLSVDLAPRNPRELRLSNPIIAASGCFGYGEEYAGVIDVQRLGAFVSKGITPERRKGNPMPRIIESPAGMLNAIGLQNPGIHGFVKKYPPLWQAWTVPAIVNISAEAVEDYAMMAAMLDEQPGIAAIEINVSCPNIARGGYCFGWDPEMSAEVTRAVRAVTTLPIIVKLSPGAADIVSVAAAVEDAGADAISLINTLVGMAIDVRGRKPLLANHTGGLSGPAIKPIAVRMVYQAAAAVRIPIIGMGGIMNLGDALEFFLAGASAIQIGTAIFVDPGLPIRLVDDLAAWLAEEGFSSVDQIVGIANDGFRLGERHMLSAWEAAGA
ncbi:MAG: dihydroorotate oxidase catalytic subunit [Thermomicrobiales bacterium]|jgi:dihydroorotate dehydrogenase (NAD+) catalytic subunit|nr:dihydroorotate oxidase catalytic subunit [Thermomicrobiales bacterium]